MEIREVQADDLKGLTTLYTQLHNNSIPAFDTTVHNLWEQILQDKNHHIIVGVMNGKIISSCVMIIVPNLTHGQRPYAWIENVIADENCRKKGYATAVFNYAKEVAQSENCYKIMLMTGSKQESTLKFYEQAGYNKKDKTAFIQWLT